MDGQIKEQELMLTTIDNPYNPKKDYDKWRIWDTENGYHTEAYMARLAQMSKDFDLNDEFKMAKLTNEVINDILENDTLGIYMLVK